MGEWYYTFQGNGFSQACANIFWFKNNLKRESNIRYVVTCFWKCQTKFVHNQIEYFYKGFTKWFIE